MFPQQLEAKIYLGRRDIENNYKTRKLKWYHQKGIKEKYLENKNKNDWNIRLKLYVGKRWIWCFNSDGKNLGLTSPSPWKIFKAKIDKSINIKLYPIQNLHLLKKSVLGRFYNW